MVVQQKVTTQLGRNSQSNKAAGVLDHWVPFSMRDNLEESKSLPTISSYNAAAGFGLEADLCSGGWGLPCLVRNIRYQGQDQNKVVSSKIVNVMG